MLFLGTIGPFFFLFFSVVRLLPMLSIYEASEVLPEEKQRPERFPQDLYRLLAEFESAKDLLRAAERLRARGYRVRPSSSNSSGLSARPTRDRWRARRSRGGLRT
jgi:hypothetical protein